MKKPRNNRTEKYLEGLDGATLTRAIFGLATPAVLGNALFTLVVLSDTLIVGWLRDEKALAATGIVAILSFVLNAPFFALSSSAGSLVSRFWGEGNRDRARLAAGQNLMLAIAMTVCIVVGLYPVAAPVLRLMGAEPEVVRQGTVFLRIILLSCILGMPLFVAVGALRGTGDTHTPMVVAGWMNVTNIVVSIVLAFGIGPFPRLGLYGVGWGTVAGRTFGGVLIMVALGHQQGGLGLRFVHLMDWQRAMLRRLTRLAWPVMMERGLNSFGHLVFIRIVAELGSTALAAHNVAVQVEHVVFMPVLGLGTAMMIIVGHAIGSGRIPLAEETIRRGVWWSLVFSGILALFFLTTVSLWIGIFGGTPDVRDQATLAIRVGTLEVIALSLTIAYSFSLRGAGDTRAGFYATLAGILVFRLLGGWLLAIVLGWGLAGAWLATGLDWSARAVVLRWICKRGKWKTLHARETEVYDRELNASERAESSRKDVRPSRR